MSTMKTAKKTAMKHWLTLLGVALGLGLGASSARADIFVPEANGDFLIRRGYTLAPNQWLTVETLGCTGSTDTVIFLLEGNVDADGNKTTRAFNDDFNGSFCAFMAFQNTTGLTKDYTVVITTYSPNTAGDVTLRVFQTPGPQTSETVRVGGVPFRFTGNASGEAVQTIPVPGSRGGKGMDSILYVIDPNVGGPAKFNDDSGFQLLSKIDNNLNCTNKECWIVAGNFWLDNGGNVGAWSQNPGGGDGDGDGISNALEQQLSNAGYLPAGADTRKDADLDGLSDFVEMVGVPATGGLAGSDNSLCMPWQGTLGGANPAQQDLFVEVDWMVDTSPTTPHSHQPFANLAADYAAIFTNDQGFTGRNIRVHLDLGASVGHANRIAFANCTGATNFYTFKNNAANFDPLRKLVYHYVIVAHDEKDPSTCANTTSTGRGELLGNDLYITLGAGNGTNDQQRGLHVHELGHNLFLDHNSNDDDSLAKRSCVHSSVMNYRYTFAGYPNSGGALRAFGYSTGACLSGNVGGCTNTCTNRCVPNGQVTPKKTCPVATSGPNMGKNVSNGTCDCDRTEWTAPGNSPVANRVSLAFQSGGEAADGPSQGDGVTASAEDAEAQAEYHQGGSGERGRFTAAIRKVADRKRAFLERQGLRAGREFVVSPHNGKVYSAD
jgi:hypothetical protein